MKKPEFVLSEADERAIRHVYALLRRRFQYDCTLLRLRNASLYEIVEVHDRAAAHLSRIRSYIKKGY